MQTESPTKPTPRNVEYDWMSIERWKKMHAKNKAIAEKGDARVVFLGDSLTEMWRDDETWKAFEKYHPVNLGIGGDKTQNVLWRLDHGEVGKLNPEAVVLLIGVNNFGHFDHSAEEVFDGTRLIIQKVRVVFPNAKILLMGVFPFEQHADHLMRERLKHANAMSASLADDEHVFFLDIGEQFLEPDGSISTDMMSDFLHLNPKGYQIWLDAVYPVIENWLDN